MLKNHVAILSSPYPHHGRNPDEAPRRRSSIAQELEVSHADTGRATLGVDVVKDFCARGLGVCRDGVPNIKPSSFALVSAGISPPANAYKRR